MRYFLRRCSIGLLILIPLMTVDGGPTDSCLAKTLVPGAFTGSLRITARNAANGQPLPGVTVRLDDRAAVTGPGGSCRFDGVACGPVSLSATASGFLTLADSVAVPQSSQADKELLLNRSPSDSSYDVVVVGAGSGGVAAALQAARMGVKVALLEETDWVGGQMTAAAVTSMDEGRFIPSNRTGIYKEFVEGVVAYYQARHKSVGTAYWSPASVAFEPSVGQMLLYKMMADSSKRPGASFLDLQLRSKVAKVLCTAGKVTGVQLAGGALIHCKVLIDATETGDVMSQTPARYRVGNSTSDAPNLEAKLNAITYTAVIRKYTSIQPPGLILHSQPPDYAQALAGFRQWLTLTGSPGIAYYSGPIPQHQPLSFAYWNAYRGMPDSTNPSSYDAGPGSYQGITRAGVNASAVDVPVTARYLEDGRHRALVNRGARLRTLQALYYLQHDLGRSDWSVADDEGFDTPFNRETNYDPSLPRDFDAVQRNLPVLPYVRESRRVIGLMTLTARDIQRDGKSSLRSFPTSLALGDYPVDLHGANADDDLDCGDSVSDLGKGLVGGVFQVPFEAFIPEKVDGLLVAEKNLSVSRLVSAATRLQPITMATGQAVGALAALSVREGIPPRQVPPIVLQSRLLADGCMLSPAGFVDVPVTHRLWPQVQLSQLYGLTESPEPALKSAFGPIVINAGASRTSSTQVGLTLSPSGTPGAAQFMQFCKDGTTWYAWEPISPQRTVTLVGGPGVNTVSVRFMDAANNISPSYSASITLVSSGLDIQATGDDFGILLKNAFGARHTGGRATLDRRTLALQLSQALGLGTRRATRGPLFADMAPSDPGFAQVQLLGELGVIPHDGGTGLFRPDDPATRGDALAFVVNALVVLKRMPAAWTGLLRGESKLPASL